MDSCHHFCSHLEVRSSNLDSEDQHPRLEVVILWSEPKQFPQQKCFISGDTEWTIPKAGVLVLLFSSYPHPTSSYCLPTSSYHLLHLPTSSYLLLSPPWPPLHPSTTTSSPAMNISWFMTHFLAFYRSSGAAGSCLLNYISLLGMSPDLPSLNYKTSFACPCLRHGGECFASICFRRGKTKASVFPI